MIRIRIESPYLVSVHITPSWFERLLGYHEQDSLAVHTHGWRWEVSGRRVPWRVLRVIEQQLRRSAVEARLAQLMGEMH
jgi:hypothetical protein